MTHRFDWLTGFVVPVIAIIVSIVAYRRKERRKKGTISYRSRHGTKEVPRI